MCALLFSHRRHFIASIKSLSAYTLPNMRFSTIQSAFLTSTLFFVAGLPAVVASGSYKGCYSDVTPLEDQGPYTFQSQGYCQNECSGKNKSVYALYQGKYCYCGDEIPASKSKVSDDNCQTGCQGYQLDKCTFIRSHEAPLVVSIVFANII